MNCSDIKYGRHRKRVAATMTHIMGSNPRIMMCSDVCLVGRLENSRRRDRFKGRKAVTSQRH